MADATAIGTHIVTRLIAGDDPCALLDSTFGPLPAPEVAPVTEPLNRRPNTYAATCKDCGVIVPAGAGYLWGYRGAAANVTRGVKNKGYGQTTWVTRCATCAAQHTATHK